MEKYPSNILQISTKNNMKNGHFTLIKKNNVKTHPNRVFFDYLVPALRRSETMIFSKISLVYCLYKNLAEIGHETSEKDRKSSVQKCTHFRVTNRLVPRKWVQFCTEDFKSFL